MGTRYVVRGKAADGTQYKVKDRQIKRMGEARGEDTFDSLFFALHNAAEAIRAWRYTPDGITFDAQPIHEEDRAP